MDSFAIHGSCYPKLLQPSGTQEQHTTLHSLKRLHRPALQKVQLQSNSQPLSLMHLLANLKPCLNKGYLQCAELEKDYPRALRLSELECWVMK